MCLKLIDGKVMDKELLGKPNSKGLYSGYKVFTKPPTAFSADSGYKADSVYHSFKWRHGWNESYRNDPYLNFHEEMTGSVQFGFHIFLNKKDALSILPQHYKAFCRKVYFKLSDVIATGTWDSNNERCVVVERLFARFD
jgi:hypothetical protein